MEFVIEKNVPMPAHRGKSTTAASAALRSMDIGDSILCDVNRRANLQTLAKRMGVKVVGRKIDEQSVRFWRVE